MVNFQHLLVGGFKHFLFSILYRIILPIDVHIFQDGYCTTNQFSSMIFPFKRSICQAKKNTWPGVDQKEVTTSSSDSASTWSMTLMARSPVNRGKHAFFTVTKWWCHGDKMVNSSWQNGDLTMKHSEFTINNTDLPSGKHTKDYGASPFSMGKSSINGYVQ